jgi:tetratricopeptide (TPR) repeat protein
MLGYEIDQFRRHAPFRRLALAGSGAQCDVNLRIVWVYNTGSGMAVASLPDDGAELLRAEAEGVYGPVYGLERLGPLVYNAFLPGTPLYNKVIDARKAREAAWQETVRQYRAAPVKPVLPEEARKFQVQAEAAFAQKEFAEAAGHYLGALKIAPWWAAGYFNRSLLLGEIERYRDAIGEMRKYLDLAPDAPDARAAQDKIYEWERLAAKSAPAQTEMDMLDQMRSEANSRTGKLKK